MYFKEILSFCGVFDYFWTMFWDAVPECWSKYTTRDTSLDHLKVIQIVFT